MIKDNSVNTDFGYGSLNGHHKDKVEEVIENGITLERYAAAKRLPIEFLKSLNLKDTNYDFSPAIRIPYPDELGRERYHRYRLALHTEPRFHAPAKSTGAKPIPYGLQVLPEAREAGYMWITEGESDTQTMWFIDEPALGIPGVQAWAKYGREWAAFLHNIPLLLVPVDCDTAGEKLWTLLYSTDVIRDRVHRVNITSPALKDLGIRDYVWHGAGEFHRSG